MLYEFGIFSTFYLGNEIPNWMSYKSEGSSISFTIPSSPNNLRGLNYCFMLKASLGATICYEYMKISNITKKRTWIYACPVYYVETREGVVFLSHWMCGKNEMEDCDQITISMTGGHDYSITECGVSPMYDEDGKMEEEEEDNVLSYYKSWNHIIGGDLSPFQTTTPGEYELYRRHFFGYGPEDKYVGMYVIYKYIC